jgi:hypothetical protein
MRVAISTGDSDRIGANMRQCSVFKGRGGLAEIALASRATVRGKAFVHVHGGFLPPLAVG